MFMQSIRRLGALLVAAALCAPAAANAGPQFVDGSGYAVSGYDVVAYRDLRQGAVGAAQPPAIKGRTQFSSEWNGAMWAFASAANRDAFLADPERYAPAYDGHCAFGVSRGYKVATNPHLWRIVDDRLYLNFSPKAAELWQADIPSLIDKGDANWRTLEPQDGPGRGENAPGFDASAAPER